MFGLSWLNISRDGIAENAGGEGDDRRLGWKLQYEGEFRSGLHRHAVHGGLNYRF